MAKISRGEDRRSLIFRIPSFDKPGRDNGQVPILIVQTLAKSVKRIRFYAPADET